MSLLLEEAPTERQASAGRAERRSASGIRRASLLFRKIAGGLLMVLGMLPVYRLLHMGETGLAGDTLTMMADLNLSLLWAGTFIAVLVGLLAAWLLPPARLRKGLARARGMLIGPRAWTFAVAAAVCTTGLSAAFAFLVLEARPSNIDAMAQLLHARYWAAGLPAGPPDLFNEFWHIQNSLITPEGWVSQYPPGHVALLALGLRMGVVSLVGPVLAGVTVLFTILAALRLMPERPATVRLGGLLLALSPFLICIGGSFMNHITSVAMLAIALYCGVRARDEGPLWALGTGGALGFSLMVRPVSTVAIGAALGLTLWLPAFSARHLRSFAARLAIAAAGAVPFVAALIAYNVHFFGAPLRFGYNVALGAAMGLGFHRDPWGNMYGPLEALGYTASDLLTLGVSLLETPISAVFVVGLYLMQARPPMPVGLRVFAAWAFVLVASNALYWHHGNYMGPRMLLEAAPGWIMLATVAGVDVAGRSLSARRLGGRFSPRTGLIGAFVFATILGVLVMAPQRARSYGGDWISIARVDLPRVAGPAVVFIHDAWVGRLGMRLAVSGMTLDSVETMLRQNPTCLVQHRADDLVSDDAQRRARALSDLDMNPRARDLSVELMQIAPGDRVRVRPGERFTGDCLREVRADSRGILDIAPLVWLGDVPGVRGGGTLFLRDFGPEANARVLAAMPERTPYVYYLASPEAEPVLERYDRAMALIWGTPEAAP